MNLLLTTAALLASSLFLAQAEPNAPPQACVGCSARKDPCRRRAGCCSTTLVDYDFVNTIPEFSGPDQDFSTTTVGGVTTDDGILTFGCQGGVLRSKPFTHWSGPNDPAETDNAKYLAFSTSPVLFPTDGKVTFEWKAGVEVFGGAQNPFPAGVVNGENDYRLGSGNFVTTSGLLSFSHMMTNDRIYVVYSILPYARSVTTGDYAAFNYVIPVRCRKPCDEHVMKIIFDIVNKFVFWQIDGKEVFCLKKVGHYIPNQLPVLDYGGVGVDNYPIGVTYGFGTFTSLNFYPAPKCLGDTSNNAFPPIREALVNGSLITVPPLYNPVLGEPNLATYWDEDGTSQTNHIWGQGVVMRLSRLKVDVESCQPLPCFIP